MNIVIIGGGAAGFFAAIAAAEANPAARVCILERGSSVLQKVKVSGGGRCNVTHACPDARELVRHYPRGSRELLAPFLRFGTTDTVQWFEQRGVRLKTEADGRMFPTTDDSQTIVDCLTNAAKRAGVTLRTSARVERIAPAGHGWHVHLGREEVLHADRVLIATGSSEAIWTMLEQLGHRIVAPAPSLFTFNTKDPRLRELAGLSVPDATVSVAGSRLSARGPVLVTHWGLSGPAILRLSAWGARELQAQHYKFAIRINWLGEQPEADILAALTGLKTGIGRKQVAAHAQWGIPQRLWERLVAAAGLAPESRWADLGKPALQKLATELGASAFSINGKSTFKEEFVTAGGVDLREVQFKTFESKRHPGLFFAGEVLDIDAITGGFNFQAAWTGGWIAGQAMVE
ncbi:MAG: NAD(P)/FAD-dependent oxidoreductase [Saprospiraceae bacterium]|nr:NAD(P)/FAD-dependent oxidoreductase [Saprospiraceae bacterium]